MFRSRTPLLSCGPLRPPSELRFRRPKSAIPESTAEIISSARLTNKEAGYYRRPRTSLGIKLRRRRPKMAAAARFVDLCPTDTVFQIATEDFAYQSDPLMEVVNDLPKVTQTVVQSHMQASHRDCDDFGVVTKRNLPSYYYNDTDKPTKGPRPTSKSLRMQANAEGQSTSKDSRKMSPKRAQQDSQGVARLDTDSPLCFASKDNNVEVFKQSEAKPKCVQFACFETENDEDNLQGHRSAVSYPARGVDSLFPDIAVQDFTLRTPEASKTWPSWRVGSTDSLGGAPKNGARYQARPPSRPESVPNPGRIPSAKSKVY